MGVLNVDGRDGTRADDAGQMMRMFISRVVESAGELQRRLSNDPMELEQIEQDVKELFDEGAGLFVSGLIAKAMKAQGYIDRCEQVRLNYEVPLKAGKDRQIQIHVASGFSLHATTRYCAPLRKEGLDDEVPGLDIELSLFGFSGGVSPWLLSKVTRTVALSGSLAQACEELQRDGIKLDKNTIDRIATRAGDEQLTVRSRMLDEFSEGKLESTNEFAGKRISVQIDGGRTRTRSATETIDPIENFGKTPSEVQGVESSGRSKEKRRGSRFQASWREPKVMKIYVHDKNGRLDAKYQSVIDGSFGDADYVEKLIAMHLYRLGASKAETITFNSDGAKWIWDRIDPILEKAQVSSDKVLIFRVLDVYHACENLHKGIAALGLGERDRKAMFADLRTRLRDGAWREVAEKLETTHQSQLLDGATIDQGEITRVLNYIKQHGEAGHLDYPKYSIMGLPLGSGSIESAIRRVVNLRMKGNGIFWRLRKAEIILALRSSILSGRWDEDHRRVKEAMKKNGKLSLPPLTETPISKSDAKLAEMETQ